MGEKANGALLSSVALAWGRNGGGNYVDVGAPVPRQSVV